MSLNTVSKRRMVLWPFSPPRSGISPVSQACDPRSHMLRSDQAPGRRSGLDSRWLESSLKEGSFINLLPQCYSYQRRAPLFTPYLVTWTGKYPLNKKKLSIVFLWLRSFWRWLFTFPQDPLFLCFVGVSVGLVQLQVC